MESPFNPKAKRSIKALLFLGFLIGGLIFAKQSFESYLNGHISYSVTKNKLTLKDQPTVTMCLISDYGQDKYTYGEDIHFNLTFNDEARRTITLVMNAYHETSLGLRVKLSELQQTLTIEKHHMNKVGHSIRNGEQWQCFRITSSSIRGLSPRGPIV